MLEDVREIPCGILNFVFQLSSLKLQVIFWLLFFCKFYKAAISLISNLCLHLINSDDNPFCHLVDCMIRMYTVKKISTPNHTYKWENGSPHLLVWVLIKKGTVHFGAH